MPEKACRGSCTGGQLRSPRPGPAAAAMAVAVAPIPALTSAAGILTLLDEEVRLGLNAAGAVHELGCAAGCRDSPDFSRSAEAAALLCADDFVCKVLISSTRSISEDDLF